MIYKPYYFKELTTEEGKVPGQKTDHEQTYHTNSCDGPNTQILRTICPSAGSTITPSKQQVMMLF